MRIFFFFFFFGGGGGEGWGGRGVEIYNWGDFYHSLTHCRSDFGALQRI